MIKMKQDAYDDDVDDAIKSRNVNDDYSGWSQLRRNSMATTSVKQKTVWIAPMEKYVLFFG